VDNTGNNNFHITTNTGSAQNLHPQHWPKKKRNMKSWLKRVTRDSRKNNSVHLYLLAI